MPVTPPPLDGAPKDQLLEFLGRRITRRQLLDERDRLLTILRAAPLGPVLLYMPNTPAAVAAILASLEAGRTLEILDPRQPEENLIARLAMNPPALVFTMDLAVLLERLQVNLIPGTPVVVARMTDPLGAVQRAIFPLLPGAGLARVPEIESYIDLRETPFPKAPAPPQAGEGDLLFNGRRTSLQAVTPMDPWLMNTPLADPDALDQLFANLAAGAVTVLSPRLDEKSLTRVAKQAGMLR